MTFILILIKVYCQPLMLTASLFFFFPILRVPVVVPLPRKGGWPYFIAAYSILCSLGSRFLNSFLPDTRYLQHTPSSSGPASIFYSLSVFLPYSLIIDLLFFIFFPLKFRYSDLPPSNFQNASFPLINYLLCLY